MSDKKNIEFGTLETKDKGSIGIKISDTSGTHIKGDKVIIGGEGSIGFQIGGDSPAKEEPQQAIQENEKSWDNKPFGKIGISVVAILLAARAAWALNHYGFINL